MMLDNVSNLATVNNTTARLRSAKGTIESLSEQLSTGRLHTNITDYSATDAKNLLLIQSDTAKQTSFLNVATTVQSRLTAYDSTLTDLESICKLSKTLAMGNQNYDPDKAASIADTAESYLKSVSVDLNQQMNGRYIYAGTRYDTAPVIDLTTLSTAPSTTIYTDNATLPEYDTGYTGVGSTDANAYTQVSATIGTGYSITYGVSSDNPAFQGLIAGLRFLQAAGESTDQTTYWSNMQNATSLLTQALTDLQTVHTTVANNTNLLKTQQDTLNSQVSSLQNRLSDIQGVDTAQVSVEITSMQALLEASYTVTGNLQKMTLANYL